MAIDSAAELLFHIGADSDDAEANVQRFRSLLGKDLDDLAGEFSEWSSKVFGDLSTVKGAMLGATAAIAAGVAAATAEIVHATNEYEKYAGDIAAASRRTQISTETMSGLRRAAEQTGTSFDALTRGISYFEVQVAKANAGGEQQLKVFGQLGISQAQLAAGEKNIIPLLELVAQRYHGMADGVERVTVARELFGRSGIETQKALDVLAQGIDRVTQQARQMGLVVTQEDVVALLKYKAATEMAKSAQEALEVQIGRATLPLMVQFKTGLLSLFEAEKELAHSTNFLAWSWDNLRAFFTWSGPLEDRMVAAVKRVKEEMKSLQEALQHTGGGELDLGVKPPKEQTTEAWEGLSDLLQRVQERTVDLTDATDPLMVSYQRMTDEVEKARRKFEELRAAGKLTEEDARNQAQALALMPVALAAMLTRVTAQIADKENAALQKAVDVDQKVTADLTKRIADQGQKTLEQRDKDWEAEIEHMRAAYAKEGQLTAEHSALLAALRSAGLQKMHRDELDAFTGELLALQGHMQQLVEAQMTNGDRLKFAYDVDLANLQRDENEKTRIYAQGDQRRIELEQMYGLLREQITKKYSADLQALTNSQGWQGVFGAQFGAEIRNNEALWKQWASSANQAQMMVRVSLQALDTMGQQTFEHFAQAEGAAIASAIVYSKSIGEAMRAALASTLESLAARSLTEAIFATAYGFMCLAEQNYEGAASAFTAAAIFGTVGGAAAVAGRFVAPSSASGAAGRGAAGAGGTAGVGQYGSQTAARQADQGGVAPPTAAGGPHITVNVSGHLVGWTNIGELTGALTDAVMEGGHTLTSTNTKTGVQVTQ
jgi:hypothetical protein